MSLRQDLIERLRLADHDYTLVEKTEHPEGKAGFQLDALLARLDEIAVPMMRTSVLAGEWAVCSVDDADVFLIDISDPDIRVGHEET